jgi:hypothetical protein
MEILERIGELGKMRIDVEHPFYTPEPAAGALSRNLFGIGGTGVSGDHVSGRRSGRSGTDECTAGE